MRILSVSEYDAAQAEASATLPNMVINCFQPVTHRKYGYPVEVRHERELVRYVDVMHECMLPSFYQQILKGITTQEFDLLQKLWGHLADFTEQWFHKPMVAKGTAAQALNVLRHIKFIYGDARPRVMELGGGSGYLGALLLLEKYPLAGMDVSQAMYIYQNHFQNFLTQGGVIEGAIDSLTSKELASLHPDRPCHIPWWKYSQLSDQDPVPFDCVICNNALCEMAELSLRYTLLLMHRYLADDGRGPKVFMFQGWGDSIPDTRANVCRLFYLFGFRLVHHDMNITVFARDDSPYAVAGLPLPHDGGGYAPIAYASPGNPISSAIIGGQASMQDEKVIPLEHLETLFTLILQNPDTRNGDEKFLDLLRVERWHRPQTP